MTIETNDVRAVFLVGDGWHEIEPDSFEIGTWDLADTHTRQEVGFGIRFYSRNLGRVLTGQRHLIGFVATEPAAPRTPLRPAD